ncbi:hypothetical protein [Asticcacaulis endophyticus]|uniref:Uncharacterized protein n=1 Tax=Asticcacaulis endophyticus TaxID=1395890 RepID=A0A918QE30_9CAUL|nr:hypothetical protein [Asticcacaulis endophyticus]GGZ41960.1 hypothetical protein GCM10011273_30910 [Asticcacaulis endophyticus]
MSNDVQSHAYTPATGAPILSEALLSETLFGHDEPAFSDASDMDVLDRIRTCD